MNDRELTTEFTQEELEEIRLYAEQEAGLAERRRFPDPDPYARPEPVPEGAPHRFWFDTEGHIRVRNFSACWLPEFTLRREIGGTVYSITGTYEGAEPLHRKVARVMEQNAGRMEGH